MSHLTLRLREINASSVVPWGTRVNQETEKQVEELKLRFWSCILEL